MTPSDLPIDALSLLERIGRALVSAADVPGILRDVCRSAARLSGADRGSVCLIDAEAAEWAPVMSEFADGRRRLDLSATLRAARRRPLRQMRLIERLATTAAPLALDDARISDAIEPRWVRRFGIRSVLGLPLALDRQVIGALVLDTVDEVRPFGLRQRMLAQAVADQLTLFIHTRVSIESEKGRGTTLTVQVPAIASPVAETPRPRAPSRGPLRILVVDDEDAVREAIALILRRDGHAVVTAPSGRAALDSLATGLVVDLVLTDLGMPDITGWTVAAAVKQRWPGLAVGLITGWGENPEATPTERGAVDFILTKPIDRRALGGALAHVAQRRAVA